MTFQANIHDKEMKTKKQSGKLQEFDDKEEAAMDNAIAEAKKRKAKEYGRQK